MIFQEIVDAIKNKFSENIVIEINHEAEQPYLVIQPDSVLAVCNYLYSTDGLLFDYLSCITGVDLFPKINELEIIYHMNSIILKHNFVLKTRVDRNIEDGVMPLVPSVTSIWKTADWHERETYDFFGVIFEGHPNMKRILLPSNWEGHPLRKDYSEQEYFHGIKVKYE